MASIGLRLRCVRCGHTWSPTEYLGEETVEFQQWVMQNIRGTRLPASCPKCRAVRIELLQDR